MLQDEVEAGHSEATDDDASAEADDSGSEDSVGDVSVDGGSGDRPGDVDDVDAGARSLIPTVNEDGTMVANAPPASVRARKEDALSFVWREHFLFTKTFTGNLHTGWQAS